MIQARPVPQPPLHVLFNVCLKSDPREAYYESRPNCAPILRRHLYNHFVCYSTSTRLPSFPPSEFGTSRPRSRTKIQDVDALRAGFSVRQVDM